MKYFELVICLAGSIWAQTAESPPSFEVASVKPSHGTTGGGIRGVTTGQMAFTGITLRSLLMVAYDLKEYQLAGSPLLDSDRFDVVTKMPAGGRQESFRPMLQNLLAERFQLKAHWGLKKIPAYVLLVAKGGPRMKVSEAVSLPLDTTAEVPPNPTAIPSAKVGSDGFPEMPPEMERQTYVLPGASRIKFNVRHETMQGFIDQLAGRWISLPVLDLTGPEARYDFTIYFVPENPAAARHFKPDDIEDPAGAPTIFAAVQSLGLKLEARKTPVKTLFVDQASKLPTDN